MFLDDEITEMVLNGKTFDEKEQTELIQNVVNVCFKRISNDLNLSQDDRTVKPIIEKVCKLWDIATVNLEKKGYPLLKKGGFKDLLLHDERFSNINRRIGFSLNCT